METQKLQSRNTFPRSMSQITLSFKIHATDQSLSLHISSYIYDTLWCLPLFTYITSYIFTNNLQVQWGCSFFIIIFIEKKIGQEACQQWNQAQKPSLLLSILKRPLPCTTLPLCNTGKPSIKHLAGFQDSGPRLNQTLYSKQYKQ